MGLTYEALAALEEARTGTERTRSERELLEALLRVAIPAAKDGHDFRFSGLLREYTQGVQHIWHLAMHTYWTGTAKWMCDGYEFKAEFKHLDEDKFWGLTALMSKPGSLATYQVNTLEEIGAAIELLG